MDLPPEELQYFPTIAAILNESTSIPNPSSRTWYCRNLTPFPSLTFAMSMSVYALPQIDTSPSASSHNISSQWTKLLFFQFCCLIFHFALFPLLSSVFTAASLCTTSKPAVVSFAIRSSVCKRLFITYLWVSLVLAVYSVVFIGSFALVLVGIGTHNTPLLVLAGFVTLSLNLADDASLCHLAGVVSGLEPVYGFAVMDLLKAWNPTAAWLVFAHLLVIGAINLVFFLWVWVVSGPSTRLYV
ncbi:hypothetical protein RHGRI_015815 [Rhododendron griersonianum]|uniref:Uncharacterized protein n=1 Tax=Rhododendron griersonianum TaxID=479676 RepID=A0AAV6JNV2_9ERIC|nr:hypothetical protein RHGRI_015815 [Rhododendron griersonianum]